MSWTKRAAVALTAAGAVAGGLVAAPAAQAEVGSSLVADIGCSTTTLAQGSSNFSNYTTIYISGRLTDLTPKHTYAYVWSGDEGPIGTAALGKASAAGTLSVDELAVHRADPESDSSPKPFSIVDDVTHEGVASGRIGMIVRDATICRVLGTLANGAIDPSGLRYFRLAQQSDGNVVERNGQSRVLWAVGTAGHPGATTTMQSDGNLVIRDHASRVLWATNTAGHANATLTVQTDDNVVLRDATGHALWSTGIHR